MMDIGEVETVLGDHCNSDIRETCHAHKNKLSGGDGVVKLSTSGRHDGGGGHDNRKRQRDR